MTLRIRWDEQRDRFLRDNFCLTNEDLARRLGVTEESIRKRYAELGIDRPKGKNPLARARNAIYRERLRGAVPDDWYSLPFTRADAKDSGATFYWDGQPCKRAQHISKRKTSSGGCWDCDYGDHKAKLACDPSALERKRAVFKNWYDSNRVEYLESQKARKQSSESRAWHRRYEQEKRAGNIEFRLAKSLRDRLYKAVTRGAKEKSAVELVGCTLAELREHLERQFFDGMTWENYGDWHIDHIRPCVSFDLTDFAQQKDCFHFSNLRPLWGDENKSKGGIWDGIDPRKKTRSLQK